MGTNPIGEGGAALEEQGRRFREDPYARTGAGVRACSSCPGQWRCADELDLLVDDLVRGKRVLHIDIELRDALREVERKGIEYRKMALHLLLLIIANARQDEGREKKKEEQHQQQKQTQKQKEKR